MIKQTGISFCETCRMWSIEGEQHDCVMKGVQYVGYHDISGKLYINLVSKDGYNWTSISPIPAPTKPNNQNKHPDNEQKIKLSLVEPLVVLFAS